MEMRPHKIHIILLIITRTQNEYGMTQRKICEGLFHKAESF